MVVLKDADIERAAKAAAFGKFMHRGQICMALNRIIVDTEIYDAFVEKFTTIVKTLRTGDPADKTTFIGHLSISNKLTAFNKIFKLVLNKAQHSLWKGQ